jgi:hypothetical protein
MTITQIPSISFGPYVTTNDVLNAVRTTIQTWSATYLAEMSRHDQQNPSIEFEVLPDFNSFPSALDLSEFVEEQMPSCIIVVPGVPSKPHRQGNGFYTAELDVGIGVAVSGQDTETTRKLASLYGAAVRQIILQNSSLGGVTAGVVWTKEEYTGGFIRPTDQRTLAIGELEFTFTIDNFANDSNGPLTPLSNANPPTGWPVVEFPSMTVTESQPGQEP